MEYRQEGSQNNRSGGRFVFAVVVFLIIGAVCVAGKSGSKAGSDKKNTAGPASGNSTYGSSSYSYRYGSGSGINYGSNSYSSGTSKKSTTDPYSSGTLKKKTTDRKSYYKQTHGVNKQSARQKAYDDYLEDALEDYLSCVDSDEEYWDAVENFGEDWLTPEEKRELDKLMDSYSK